MALLVSLAACARQPAPHPRACQRVQGLPGAEDFALDLAHPPPRLLVSSQERRTRGDDGAPLAGGQIAAVELGDEGLGPARPLILRNRDTTPFHPHGIDVWTTATGETRLFVINHVNRDTHLIEEFGVLDDALVFRRRLQHTLMHSPNDLVVAGDDELYVSNDRGLPASLMLVEGALGLPCGNLVHYRQGQWTVLVEGVAYANGLEIDVTGEHLYLAAVRENRVREYPRDPGSGALGEMSRHFDLGSGVDNLLWMDSRTLIAAAHPDMLVFARHATDAGLRAPSQIFRIDVEDASVRRLFEDDGHKVSAASTGWVHGGRVIMGQVFDDGVVSCAIP